MTSSQSTMVFSGVTSMVFPSHFMKSLLSEERIFMTDNGNIWGDTVKQRLEELVRLPFGWDGYDGTPVSVENASFAFRVLDAICGLETRAPQIVPGPSGDLQIEWHTLKGDLEIHIKGPNNVHAWHSMATGDPEGEDLDLRNDFAILARWVEEIAEPSIAASTPA